MRGSRYCSATRCRFQLEGRGRETGQLGMWARSRDAGFSNQRRDSLGDRLSRSFMRVRIHDRGALSWFQLGRALGFSGSGCCSGCENRQRGEGAWRASLHEVILRVWALANPSLANSSAGQQLHKENKLSWLQLMVSPFSRSPLSLRRFGTVLALPNRTVSVICTP
jgi:hypothetical protein